jgi:hypothetical protein
MKGKVILKLDKRPHCNFGWMARKGGDYTGGHYCVRLADHHGRCICDCGRRHKKPAGWKNGEDTLGVS